MNLTGSFCRKEVLCMSFPVVAVLALTWKLVTCAYVKKAGRLLHLSHLHTLEFSWLRMKPVTTRQHFPCFVIRLQDGSTKNFMCRPCVSNRIYVRKPGVIMRLILKKARIIY